MHLRDFNAGEVIFTQGGQGAGAILVLNGEVRVSADKTELARLRDGDFFGEIALAASEKRTADATATSAQVFDNLVVIPSVAANAVNLHPVQAILGIIIFGSLFGTVGIIVAVPAIAAGKIVFKNIYTDIANASLKATP